MSDNKLLAKLKGMPTSQGKNKPFENLSPAHKREWVAIKQAMKNGELDHLSRNEIRRQVAESFSIPKLTETTFRKILIREGVMKVRNKE